jgi:hypothetical protein
VLILDEAHNAAPASNSLRYAIDSGLTRSLRARFVRGVPFDPKDLDTVLVRRLKDELRRIGEEFPERIVEPLAIPRGSLPPDTPELKLSRLLQNYRKQREERLIREGAGKRELNAERLVITNLQKRLLSSIEAFARTLKVHSGAWPRSRSSGVAPWPLVEPSWICCSVALTATAISPNSAKRTCSTWKKPRRGPPCGRPCRPTRANWSC